MEEEAGAPDLQSAEAALDIQQAITEVFEKFDVDGDGTIDRQELALLLSKSNAEAWSDDRLDMLLSQVDTNRDGRIDFDEFLSWVFSDKTGQKTLKGALNAPVEEPDSSLGPYDGPRWMLHDTRSEDYPTTTLRVHPSDAEDYKPHSALNGEVVEVLGARGNYLDVRLALTRALGWIHQRHLHQCIEGTAEAACIDVQRIELQPSDGRLKDVRKFLRRRNTTRNGGDIRASRVWFLRGHYLGQVGLADAGPKETVFFGCGNDWVESIATSGFSEIFASAKGMFGKGLHLSPQSCKAYMSSENYMFVCEAALGKEDDRMTLTAPHPELNYEEVCQVQGKLSAQCHAGKRFDHEERIVYHPGQCKPVYLLELDTPGLYNFSIMVSPYKDLLKKQS